MLKKEEVRLVIWDLDETFWRGTLTEGGIQEYIQQHHNIVIELAKRGIISSICSKNHYITAQEVLEKHGIWDYFILPSIDWTPKGPRLQELIRDLQLRPETVLFIDDNASNRAEAELQIPGLQVADESILSTLLTNALFQGKEDLELTRLKQYQLLQRRKTDEKAANSDNSTFLRSSNIWVTIEPNIELHLDRAIELVNRTNQLNFTKSRLSEKTETAKEELKTLASRYFSQAGLIRVRDKYGDYGFCGLYVTCSVHDIRKLVHFCFSCRILGMGVERWLYQKLGKPNIQISGEVHTDLNTEGKVDWINQSANGALLFSEAEDSEQPTSDQETILQTLAPEIRLRGGCELDALSHYLQLETPTLSIDTNYANGGFLIRQDTSTHMALSLSTLSEQIKREITLLGFQQKDFEGRIFASPPAGTFFVISTWGDLYLPIFRHNTLGFEINVALRKPGLHDLTKATPHEVESYLKETNLSDEEKENARRIIQHLSMHYTFVGLNIESLYRNWKKIFDSIPKDCLLIVLLPNTQRGHATGAALEYHTLVQHMAQHLPQVFTLDITSYIKNTQQDDAVDHLNRMVYFDIYKALLQNFGRKMALASKQHSESLEGS